MVLGFVYLHLAGVPGPILRKVLDDMNQQGVRVDIDRVYLTWQGWQALNVRYFSEFADDLEPLVQIDEIYLRRNRSMRRQTGGGHGYGLDARGIRLSPSTAWCEGMPEDSVAA